MLTLLPSVVEEETVCREIPYKDEIRVDMGVGDHVAREVQDVVATQLIQLRQASPWKRCFNTATVSLTSCHQACL